MTKITTLAELNALPAGSLIRADGEVYERIEGEPRVNGETWRCLHEPRDDYGWRTYPADTVLWQGTPVTVLFRPDAPQPATTDELIDALDIVRSEDYGRDQRDAAYDRVAAALAAVGAGAEVDREALHQQAYRLLTGRDEPWGGCDQREAVERISEALAARGDAATPTEVEWGVRDSNGVETHYGSGTTAEVAARRILAIADGFTLIQRTVSAWREVTP